MSQDWVANLYTTATVGDTTLSNMELMFATLKTSFSGASSPGSPNPGQLWYDTTKKLLKHRDYGDTAWRGVLAGSALLKLWIYANAAQEGWAIDSSVTDRVLALKGGSTYTTGGANAGSWTIGGLTKDAHTHSLSAHVHSMQGHTHTLPTSNEALGQPQANYTLNNTVTGGPSTSNTGGASPDVTGAQSDAGITSDATWRPAAAVGTLQYPDV